MISRRRLLAGLGALGGLSLGHWPSLAETTGDIQMRVIPSTGERIPAVGMGSWITFNVGEDSKARAARMEVLRTFLDQGGTLIDSSPMYGSSEAVLGYCLRELNAESTAFSATKVWTSGRQDGVAQMAESERLWGTPKFDLMQVHNLLDWEVHLETLREWKDSGRIRYLGVTTSHGRRLDLLERVMIDEALDFVQLTYNIRDRWAEPRLLPLARERGVAIIVNRPFDGGELFPLVASKPLPSWAKDYDCANWAQYFLKFLISHPAVTCAIPATSRVDHMLENMGALRGRLPDPAARERMASHFQAL